MTLAQQLAISRINAFLREHYSALGDDPVRGLTSLLTDLCHYAQEHEVHVAPLMLEASQLVVQEGPALSEDQDEYRIFIEATRYHSEDDEIAVRQGRNLVDQYVAELQDAYEEMGVAGSFRVLLGPTPAKFP